MHHSYSLSALIKSRINKGKFAANSLTPYRFIYLLFKPCKKVVIWCNTNKLQKKMFYFVFNTTAFAAN